MRRHPPNAHKHNAHATAHHANESQRSPVQRLIVIVAGLLGAAPLGFGLFRAWQSDGDYRMFWMAVAASLFAGGTLVAAIGRRRSQHAVKVQALAIVIVSTLLAGATAYVFGATAWFGIWAVAAVFGGCLSLASMVVSSGHATKH